MLTEGCDKDRSGEIEVGEKKEKKKEEIFHYFTHAIAVSLSSFAN